MDRITPLSAHLRAVTDHANEYGPPQLQRWLLTENPEHWMGLIPREEELLAVTDRLLNRLHPHIGFSPALVTDLYRAFHEANKNPDAYLQGILSQQRDMILEFLKGKNTPVQELERLQNSIIRGRERLLREASNILDEIEDLETFVENIPAPTIRVRPGASARSIDKKIHKTAARLAHQRTEAYYRRWDRVDRIFHEISERDNQIDLLSTRILIRHKLEERLPEIETIIGPIPTTTTPSSPDLLEKPIQNNPPPPAPPLPHTPSKKRKHRRAPQQPATETEKPPQTIGALDLSLQKIYQAIELAEQGNNKIRIVTTNAPNRATLHQRWEVLLKRIGFTGTIEFIDFPQNNGDLSPILIPRGLNTHDTRWDRTSLDAKYFVVDIPRPNLLLNHIENPGGNRA